MAEAHRALEFLEHVFVRLRAFPLLALPLAGLKGFEALDELLLLSGLGLSALLELVCECSHRPLCVVGPGHVPAGNWNHGGR